MFQGFSQESVDFLWGIRLNNERSWFLAHKEDFHTHVEGPMKELAAQVTAAMQEEFPELGLEKKISRIYRDARRLHGRGPYKDHLWFTLRRPGTSEAATPCFYFELAPNYYSIGMGCYDATPLTMAKLRARIDRDPATMEDLTRKLNEQAEFALETADYKKLRAPAPSEILEPWYRAKYFSIGHEEKLTEELFSREIVDRLKQGYEFLLPYYDYFVTLDGDRDPREELKEH